MIIKIIINATLYGCIENISMKIAYENNDTYMICSSITLLCLKVIYNI